MFRLLFAVGSFLAIADPASASSPDPKSLVVPGEELSRARELVQQLGSEQFAERERAELALAKMGRLARPALLEAANTDPNQEVRARCTALLPKATALEIRARLDVFLADTEGKFEHDLPGWNEFRATVRNEWHMLGHLIWSDHSLDKGARGAFADLLTSTTNRHILMAVSGPQSELGSIVSARRQELYYQKYPRAIVVGGALVRPSGQPREPSAEDIATLLFAESLVASKFSPRTLSITALIQTSGFIGAVKTTGDRGKVYRAIAAAWVDSRQDPVEMYQVMTTANSLGLSEHGCRIGIRLLTMPGANGSCRGMAATNLARIGNKDHIPLLEKALKDSTVAYTIRRGVAGQPNEVHDVQVRDMALAVAVILSGQKLDDYGFVDNFKGNGAIGVAYTYSRFYIPDDNRNEMHAKWKEWRAKNP